MVDEIKRGFDKDLIKDAFAKIKQEIQFLHQELSRINNEIQTLKIEFQYKKEVFETSTHLQKTSTHPVKTSTHLDTSTDNLPLEALKPLNFGVSIGNQGASTDRQTDRQTDTSTHKLTKNLEISDISEISEIFASLDNFKKDLRLKFKRLTPKEMLVFSTIYALEDQTQQEKQGEKTQIDYKTIANKLNLSESSIRDYVQRIIIKGIPLIKTKIKNKQVIIGISPELKKITTLDTILKLREL